MKYFIILSSLALYSCNETNEREDQYENEPLSYEDSLWMERNNFLSHALFEDKTYQESEFKKYEGLWNCIKTEHNRDNKAETPKYSDLLFSEGKAWMLDYPCSWNMQGYAEEVYFRNDSYFLAQKIAYI